MPDSLTACLIVRDEESRLPACLESITFCDEVVVVDGGSGDRTVEIARASGAKVIENPWPGFAAQRNVALDHAHGDWVLEIDADEQVSPELQADIKAMLAESPPETMAGLATRDIFLGRALGPSTRYPRYRHRLFRRAAFRHDESRAVHEGLWPDGPALPLDGELTHLLASSWSEALRDARAYARLEATQRGRSGVGEALTGTILRPAAKLAYRLLPYGGWRDGWRGVTKLSLECGADSLMAVYRLRSDQDGEPDHWQPPRLGPVRIVGLALGGRRGSNLDAWLAQAADAGADVALIAPGDGGAVRRRALPRGTPGNVLRALDAEDQLRPIDAVLPAGRRERLLLRCAPSSLRGVVEPLSPSIAPELAVRGVQESARDATSTP